MAEYAVANLFGEIEPVTILFEHIDHTQALLVVAKSGPEAADRRFAGMAERGMAEIVTHADGFDQVFVQAQCAADGPRDLGHFQRMRKAGSIVVARRSDEDLSFVHEPAKRFRVNDPVTVALELHRERAKVLRG